jgi:hypothetical protein
LLDAMAGASGLCTTFGAWPTVINITRNIATKASPEMTPSEFLCGMNYPDGLRDNSLIRDRFLCGCVGG